MASRLFAALTRKKPTSDEGGSKLARVLTLLDLIGLGVGSTLGLGVYVLAGSVAKSVAGPAVCLSFLIAAIASAFAGLCYAEFAARVPKAGSAYVYSYVSVGEFVAYTIGWNLILEYVIGVASVARGLSNYIDALTNNTMKNALSATFPMHVNFLAPYPDLLAFALVGLFTVVLASGVKESTRLNNVLTGLNLMTVITVIIAGSIKADVNNWKIPKEDIPPNANGGEGGFMPFGFSGVMAGAARCFFGFVGFDCIATTGEEAKKPQRNIPLAIVTSLMVIFCAYFGISTVLTMMWPYYDQDPDAPFPHVFEQVGWHVIKWIVTIGAIFALCTSLLGAMFPLPRVVYAMSSDGLLFSPLSKVHPRTKTPLIATFVSGTLAGTMALIFDLEQLIDMMSIGTLLAYTIVAICVLILRYEEEDQYKMSVNKPKNESFHVLLYNNLKTLFNLNMNKKPDDGTSSITKWSTVVYCLFAIGACVFIKYGTKYISPDHPLGLASLILIAVIMVVIVTIIGRQPTSNIKLSFKVPGVPVIPCLSMFMNLYLMVELDVHTWIRFAIWLIIGFVIYFLYSIRYSKIDAENISHGVDNPTFVSEPGDMKICEPKEMTKC